MNIFMETQLLAFMDGNYSTQNTFIEILSIVYGNNTDLGNY